MSQEACAFLEAVSQLPRSEFPATHNVNALLRRIIAAIQERLPPHLRPLLTRLHAFSMRQTFALEKRLHINPTFKLLLGLRIVPPGLAFIAAAASTIYAVRYLYTNALDLLTNIIGVAYPAYQSMMAIEYGGVVEPTTGPAKSQLQSLERALGIVEPNLDKKQWLMYWAVYGVLTTADHWAGPLLRLFPMYRIAKIGVLVWAQHRKYNGATWLYDTLVRPLLPPTNTLSPPPPPSKKKPRATHMQELGLADNMVLDDVHAHNSPGVGDNVPPPAFSSLSMPSVWESATANVNIEQMGARDSAALLSSNA
ncbi:hypothetical protein GGF37_001295 [Kickxella alabastrina]|nr:hypothetical protein GGF37_001295 [Kickxella alabastrina]